MLKSENFKVAVVGLGRVGTTAAYTILLRGLASELVLFSRELAKAEGEKADLEHGSPFYSGTKIIASNRFEDLDATDLVIFTAGSAQKPGQSRLDLARENCTIVDTMIPKIVKHASRALILMVSNPLDVMTYRASVVAGLPHGRVFGSGTLLDTARLRLHLSKLVQVNPTSIHAYVLGEHGDSSFAPTSTATIGGKPLISFEEASHEHLAWAHQETSRDAYKIISSKGATYYGIAAALSHLVDIVKNDKKSIVPLSVPLTGQYGLKDVALSLPCILGRSGVEKVIDLPLTFEEKTQLENSAAIIREHLSY